MRLPCFHARSRPGCGFFYGGVERRLPNLPYRRLLNRPGVDHPEVSAFSDGMRVENLKSDRKK